MEKIFALFLCLLISTRVLSGTSWDNVEFWDYAFDKQKITVDEVKKKLSEGWNINTKTIKYPQETLLMYAVKNNNTEIAEFLLKNRADVNKKNGNGITALFYAQKDKQIALPMWQLLLKYGADINVLDKSGKSILVYETVSLGSADFMEFLVENGVKVDNTNIKEHPLFYLFYSGSSDPNDSLYKQRKLDLLLKAGADINVQNLRGQTPLMFTAKYKPTFLKLLLERGADPTILDDEGKNALTCLRWQKPEYIQLLTDAGVKVSIKDIELGQLWAKSLTVENIKDFSEYVNNYGVNLNIKNKDQITPLMSVLIWNQNPIIIEALIKSGADVDARGNNGETALLVASALIQNPEIIDVLIKNGADVNLRGNDGETALMAAAGYNKNPAIVDVLIKNGADVKIKDRQGKTALDYAKDNPKVYQTNAYKNLKDLSNKIITVKPQKIKRNVSNNVIKNPNIKINTPKCGSHIGNGTCVYYIQNTSNKDKKVSDFFYDVQEKTGRDKFVITQENPNYTDMIIPPGKEAEIKIPELR